MEQKINANLVIELLGRPKEHLEEALQTHVLKLGSEKGVSIKNKILHPAILVQDSKTLFTTFAELEVEFDSLEKYFGIIFAYLPSHIELISPEKIIVANSHMNDLANGILQRIHGYDSLAKNLLAERENIFNIMKQEAPDIFNKLLESVGAKPESTDSKKQEKIKPKGKKKTKKK